MKSCDANKHKKTVNKFNTSCFEPLEAQWALCVPPSLTSRIQRYSHILDFSVTCGAERTAVISLHNVN
jgi:hypothetical protein